MTDPGGGGDAGGGETPPAPGWWKASDGRWYPPESAPTADPAPEPPADPEATLVGAAAEPAAEPSTGEPATEVVSTGSEAGGAGDEAGGAGDEAGGAWDEVATDAGSNRTKVIVAGAVVAALAAAAIVFFLLGGDDDEVVVGGTAVDDDALLAALADGERMMGDEATREDANLAGDAACFLSRASEDASDINSFVRCGPVLFLDSPSTDHRWMTGDLRVFEDVDGTTEASVGNLARNTTLASGEVLFRPDGREPSTEDLAIPDPPPVERGFTLTTTDQLGVDLDPLGDARLVGVQYTLDLRASARVDRIGDGPEALIPADGEEFLVVRYELDHETGFGTDAPRAAVGVDGIARSIELPVGSNTLVVAVDAGAAELTIEIQDVDTEQAVSALTGERQAGYPEVLYRDRRRIAVNDTTAIPFTVVGTSGNPSCDGSGQLQVRLGDAELVWSRADSQILGRNDTLPRAREAGEAWLVVEIANVDGSYTADTDRSCTADPEVPADQVSVTADGDPAVTAGATLSSDRAWLAFTVPAGTNEATIRIQPGDGVRDGRGFGTHADATYNFGGAAGEITMVFSTASASPDDGDDEEDEG